MPTHAVQATDIWSVKGRFQHLVYSPKGAIEGLIIDTDGVPTQYVTEPHDSAVQTLLSGLSLGQVLVLEGTEAGPSPKGEPQHTVYHLERIASVDGRTPMPQRPHVITEGKIVRFNYARHGEPNGVVLDNGDFVHTRPDGMAELGLRIGDAVAAEGEARLLTTGHGRVVEAIRVNGQVISSGA
jgi:hypothetical protein